jgi:uncharacterized protein YceH (UPF0502 family)
MPSEPETPAPGVNGPWPVLDMEERRVLGVMVEKAKTTPDAYPMSVNALVTGSNQKSNRDPVLNLTEDDVEEALARCQKKGLAIKITGGRVVRWRHALYEAWRVDKIDLAVLAELLLRGPQTEGELRTRASRMESLDDLDALRAVLKPLVERNLVLYLTPEDRRGAVLTHGFHDPRELEPLRKHHAAEPVAPSAVLASTSPRVEPAPPPPLPVVSRAEQMLPQMEASLASARDEIAALKQTVAQLHGTVQSLAEELRGLKRALGV